MFMVVENTSKLLILYRQEIETARCGGDLSAQQATRTLRSASNHEVTLRAEKWAQQAHDGIQWFWNSRESLDQLNNPQLVGLRHIT